MSLSYIYEITSDFCNIEEAKDSSIEVTPEDIRWLVSTVDRVDDKEKVLPEHIRALINDFDIREDVFKQVDNLLVYKVSNIQKLSDCVENYCLNSLQDCITYIFNFLAKDKKDRSYSRVSYELATLVDRGSSSSPIFGIYEGSWIDIVNAYELLERIKKGLIKELYITGVYEYHL